MTTIPIEKPSNPPSPQLTIGGNGDIFHAALSFREIKADLADQPLLATLAESIIVFFQLRVVESYWHHYSPIGMTGVYVLEQSSLTLHTWPEFNKLVIDVTTCGAGIDMQQVVDQLCPLLQTNQVVFSYEIL